MSYFTEQELACSCCGANHFDDEFLALLNRMREQCGFPFPVSSGYRCPNHPVEAKKKSPGAHTTGQAVDILAYGARAQELVRCALNNGIKRIGIAQKGDIKTRFIHLDIAQSLPSPAFWSY